MSPIQVLLVDDSPEFLESAARFLSADPHVRVVGRALSGRQALEQIVCLQPDVVLMDWAMPDIDGLEATRQIKKRLGAPYVVILTLHDNDEYRLAAQAAGADGYITKSEFGTELLPFVHRLFAVAA